MQYARYHVLGTPCAAYGSISNVNNKSGQDFGTDFTLQQVMKVLTVQYFSHVHNSLELIQYCT